MKDLSSYRGRPYQFIGRFIAAYPYAHFGIGMAVIAAVFCSVSTQYGVKFLVDALAVSASQSMVWMGFALLAGLIAADNLLWRVASWIANATFVDVSGAVRRTLFSYLTGHAPSYFQNQPPGALASRITATSNALYTGETMVTFNVLPPLIATIISVAYMATVSLTMAAVVALAGAKIGAVIFHYARRASASPGLCQRGCRRRRPDGRRGFEHGARESSGDSRSSIVASAALSRGK